MTEEILKLNRGTVTFCTEMPKEIGAEMDLEVALPNDVNLSSFTLNGTITDCRHIRNNGTSVYMLEMDIGELSKKNSLILEAYIDFLEREERLNKIRKDNQELQDALNNLGEKLRELIAVSEMMIKEAKGKVTIH
jgi:hypothetical protein